MATLEEFIGEGMEDDFLDFDLSEIQEILNNLKNTNAIDLAHSEYLQQRCLNGADVLIEYLGKLTKMAGFYETKINTAKNKASLEYQSPDGKKASTDIRIWAGAVAPEVEELQIKMAKIKASRLVIEKKYDLLIKAHHHWKSISDGYKKSILGYSAPVFNDEKDEIPEGYR